MPADLSAEPHQSTVLRTSTDSSPATSLGYRDRRLCRPPDWADLDTACVVQREIPTRDIGTILFGCLDAMHFCASAPLPAQDLHTATRSSAPGLE